MRSSQLTLHLLKNDLRLIRRDQTLYSMVWFALLIAIILRILLPWLNEYLAEKGVLPNDSLKLTLSDVYPMLIAFFALFNGAQISGAIFGFLLLDEKDQRTIGAIQVSPVSMPQFLLCRLCFPTLLGFLFCAIMMIVIGQVPIPFWKLLPIAASASLLAPIMALFLASFAENKVQGFAIAKFAGVAGWTILFGWFVAEPFQWIFGLFPPFLASKSYWMAMDSDPYWQVTLGLSVALQLLLIFCLVRKFQRTNRPS